MSNTVRLLVVVFALIPALSFAQCKSLRKKTNKIDSVTTIHSPYNEAAIALKVLTKQTTRFTLVLTAPASASGERQGVTLLLDNGLKLEFPDEKVTVKVETYHPRWSNTNIVARSQLTLTDDQVKQLAQHRIVSYQLYVFDWDMRERLGSDLQKNINCLLTATPDVVKE